MIRRQYLSLLRWSCREAWRTRFFAQSVLTVLALVLLAGFAAALAVTEAAQYRAMLYAAGLRLALVFSLALHVCASVVRERETGALELVLSRPVARWVWFAGRLSGLQAVALGALVLGVLPLLAWGEAGGVAAFAAGLAGELLIAVTAAFVFAIALDHLVAAFAAFTAFYLAARSMAAILLIAGGATLDQSAAATRLCAAAARFVAWVLPGLDRFAPAAWVVHGPPCAALAIVAVQTLVYCALLVAIGQIDLQRRNL
jgi:ABC-type transport system involved in multi-copper enzyme maturation permease subunit